MEIGSDEAERGGLLLPGDQLVELTNVHPEPTDGYMPDPADVLPLISEAVGTWHTHPRATATPSAQDLQSWSGWPAWEHVIVGTDGVRRFRVKNGMAIDA